MGRHVLASRRLHAAHVPSKAEGPSTPDHRSLGAAHHQVCGTGDHQPHEAAAPAHHRPAGGGRSRACSPALVAGGGAPVACISSLAGLGLQCSCPPFWPTSSQRVPRSGGGLPESRPSALLQVFITSTHLVGRRRQRSEAGAQFRACLGQRLCIRELQLDRRARVLHQPRQQQHPHESRAPRLPPGAVNGVCGGG